MPVMPDFDEIHVAQFTDTIRLLAQQIESRVASRCESKSCIGEQSQAVMNLTPVDPTQLTAPTYNGGSYDGWMGDTVWDSIEHLQRWLVPSTWKSALPISSKNLQQMLVDPRSEYARTIAAGMARRRDETVTAAALGAARTGAYDTTATTALPASQKILVPDATVQTNLSVQLLLDTWQKLEEADHMMMEERYFVTTAEQLRHLLNDDQVTSADYNTVRALAEGTVDSYLGFNFIRYEKLPKTTTGTSGEFEKTSNFAFLPSGLMEGRWPDANGSNGFTVRVDERPDKNYTWQIYATMTTGAVRTEDTKVVQVDTTHGTVNA